MKEQLNNTKISNSTKTVLCNGLKSTDLRIGNLVTENTYGVKRNGKIKAIKEKQIVLRLEHSVLATSIKNIEPIKTTKENLIKMGFFIVEINGTFEATLPNFRYTIQTAKDYDGFFFCDGETVLTNFNYVHELQNLVFVLAQRELTVA